MKKIFLVLLAISSITAAQLIGPKISVQQLTHDFGNITQGEEVSHEFVISNSGDDSLKIKDVKASCGCTAAKPEKSVLLPGESTKLKVNFNSKNFKGIQKKYVYVKSNDKDKPEIRLNFTANVLLNENPQDRKDFARLLIETPTHNFGDLKEGKIVEWNVELKNVGNENLEIKDIKTTCGCTAAVIKGKNVKPGESTTLRIEFDSTGKRGKQERKVILKTNDPYKPEHEITLTANVLDRK